MYIISPPRAPAWSAELLAAFAERRVWRLVTEIAKSTMNNFINLMVDSAIHPP